ncbi:hypothetical protein [[Leptolyngbya] sp. PCC 7376]|uniref:hypothetical protein n=1 Tax=[Leptolyngbya] sp. PCC 7376 TaxID=111781 RepID=UPI001C1E79E9|nr:hypothetical protein [[Leptolyngbya] sp. PCC 7376]
MQKQLLETGLAEKSVSEDFEEKFAAFYLSEQTYLGQCAKTQLGKTCFGESDCRDEDFDCCS